MFFFNMFIFILHYLILEISFNQIDNPGFDKMSVFSIFRLYLTAILGFIFAWKEFFICFVSLITGTTAYERARDLEVSYFKSRGGNTLCFYKVFII